MPRRRRVVRKRRGMGFFGDLWSGIKSGVGAVNSVIPIKDILKQTGAISTGLSLLPGIGGIASRGAQALGYGRRRRRKRRGGNVIDGNMKILVPSNMLIDGGRRRKRKRGGNYSTLRSSVGGSNLAF